MKKSILIGLFALISFGASAQNVQLHYDFGHLFGDQALQSRPHVTTTVEMFRPDAWGSTFFFVDLDYYSVAAPVTTPGVVGAYWEIARELCFWQESNLNWLSLHLEYNGGLNRATSFNNAYLAGLTYSGHSADFSKTWSLSAMYKYIPGTVGLSGSKQPHNFQLTGVWGINFANNWCTFSGFVDFWKEERTWQNTSYIFLSEPQFWVNMNKIKGCNVNLSLGGEVELSYNFVGAGFYAIPTLAAKWTF